MREKKKGRPEYARHMQPIIGLYDEGFSDLIRACKLDQINQGCNAFIREKEVQGLSFH